MNEFLQTVILVLRSLARFRWLALGITTVLSLGGWAFVQQMEDVYEAKARVFVDTNRVLGPLLKGIAIQDDVEQQVSLMSRTLLNRPNIEKLIRTTELDRDAITELEREQLSNRVRGHISLSAERNNASLYSVSYSDSERERARRVVQGLLTIFIEETIGDTREDSATAQRFLDQQIVRLEQRLGDSERRLSDFKRENAGKTPGESGGYYARLATATGQARGAKLELAEARNRRDLLQLRIRGETPTLQGEAAGVISGTELKLEEQRDELDALLVRFTERHPRVSQLRSSIVSLEAQVERERGAPRRSRGGGTFIANPAYQEIRASLTEAEARVAELEVRTVEYDRQVDELETTVESIPRVEAELAQLDRDYGIVREQYDTLLQRRESARLSEQVEQNVDDVQFRVVDPPYVPVRPTAPKKWLLSAGAFAASVGAGGAAAFALALLMPVYYTAEEIAARSGRTPIGTVSLWRNRKARAHARFGWIVYICLFLALTALCALIVLFQRDLLDIATLERLSGLPLEEVLERIDRTIDRVVDGVKRQLESVS